MHMQGLIDAHADQKHDKIALQPGCHTIFIQHGNPPNSSLKAQKTDPYFCLCAQTAASSLLVSLNLLNRCLICTLTVVSLIPRLRAIVLLLRPCARHCSISCSLSVREISSPLRMSLGSISACLRISVRLS